MLLVGLTGGIGSGKSTVARMLSERGAVVFDADEMARRAIDPGTPGHAAVIERFGAEVVGPDGSIDRAALASRVFDDAHARQDLEAIVHPEVYRLLQEGLAPYRDIDRVVVFDAPLIVETGFQGAFDVLVLVTAPEDVRVARVAAAGRMSQEEARARMSAQLSDEEKVRVADVVLRNDGSVGGLDRQVAALWQDLRSRQGEPKRS